MRPIYLLEDSTDIKLHFKIIIKKEKNPIKSFKYRVSGSILSLIWIRSNIGAPYFE